MGGGVQLAIAYMLTHLRFGSAALLTQPLDQHSYATLAKPTRGALRALSLQCGGLALLLSPSNADAATADGAAAAPDAALNAARGSGSRLVVVGPPRVVRHARALVGAWQQSVLEYGDF